MKYFLFLFLIFSSSLLFSQSNSVEKRLIKVDFLFPGLEIEKKISNNTTIMLNPGLGFNLVYSESLGNKKTDFSLFPFFDLQYRYYYNLNSRVEKMKSIQKNSGNFLAFKSLFVFSDDFNDLTYGFGGIWGFQRTYVNKFNLSLELGIGYFPNTSNRQFSPIISFTLGRVISK